MSKWPNIIMSLLMLAYIRSPKVEVDCQHFFEH